MSYVIQLTDGSFVIIDGGTNTTDHATTLYNYLVSRVPNGKKPNIACWFITHSDLDHIGLATAFLSTHKNNITVKSFAYNFQGEGELTDTDADAAAQTRITNFISAIDNNFPDAKKHVLQRGDTLNFTDISVDILLTPDDDDIYTKDMVVANDASVVFRVNFLKSEKTFLVLGDCQDRATANRCTVLANYYKDALKSDILQVTHHGLAGGALALYEYIKPSVCLWSSHMTKLESSGYGPDDGIEYNDYLWELSGTSHYYSSETVTLVIDDVITKGN